MEQNCDDADGEEPKRRWKDEFPWGFHKLGGKKEKKKKTWVLS